MRVGSVFSGIAGLDRGIEAVIPRVRLAWFAEIDPQARRVLAAHYPGVKCYTDVRQVDEKTEAVDIICGGFPCQDISSGKREGIRGKRSGLWAEYARVVRELRPAVVFIENVASLAVRGLDVVLADLAALGFDAEWDLFRASDVGAPHKRERIFILAYAAGEGRGRETLALIRGGRAATVRPGEAQSDGRGSVVPDAEGDGRPIGTCTAASAARGRQHGDGGAAAGLLSDAHGARREGDAGGVPPGGRPSAAGHGGGLVANSDGDGLRLLAERDQRDRGGIRTPEREHPEPLDDGAELAAGETLADANGRRWEGERIAQPGGERCAPGGQPDGHGYIGYFHHFPPGPARIGEWDGPQPAVRRGDDGVPVGMDRRWRAKNGRPDRLRLLGNAVVPQQATLAFLVLVDRAISVDVRAA